MDIKQPIVWTTTSHSLVEFSAGLKHVIEGGCHAILLLTCVENDYDNQQINQILKECPVPICGGMFPQIIIEDNIYPQGAIIIGLMFEPAIKNYTMLTTANTDLEHYVENNSAKLDTYKNFIIIGDTLSSANEDFIDVFYNYIGSGITVIGGGVGSLDFKPRPCIYSNQGLIGDSMQVIAIPYPITRGVGHGWEILAGPYLVTDANKHTIMSLNYKPAFEVYRDEIKNNVDQTIDKENFFDIAKNYPLGISGISNEILVRDPIKSDGESLECVANVPTNSMVYLLKGEQNKMILSAGQAGHDISGNSQSTMLLFDCITRGLFLEENFSLELKAIQKNTSDSCLLGVMSLSEITNTQSGAIRLLNKSIVIGAL